MKEKRRLNYFLSLVIGVVLFAACNSSNDRVSEGSSLNTAPKKMNTLDQWIYDNYTQPYNIDVVYRWDNALHDLGRYLYPPTIDSVKPALELIKQVWIDPYNQVGGADFIKNIAPRQLVLVGGKNKNPSGTRTLGLAEAGKRITLFEVDDLNKKSRFALNQFMHTIQHEYGHILNQTNPFDEATYRSITPEGYTAQWFNEKLSVSNGLGFITSYARADVGEDFVEMIAGILTKNKAQWEAGLNNFPKEFKRRSRTKVDTIVLGKDKIKRKEQMVANYYKEQFSVDLYVLQDSVYKATTRYLEGKVKTNR